MSSICTHHDYCFTLSRFPFSLSPSNLPFLSSFPASSFSVLTRFCMSFIFLFFFILVHSFVSDISCFHEEERPFPIGADRWWSVSPVHREQPLSIVFYLRRPVWSISGDVGMTRLLGPSILVHPLIFLFRPRASFEGGCENRMTVKWPNNLLGN